MENFIEVQILNQLATLFEIIQKFFRRPAQKMVGAVIITAGLRFRNGPDRPFTATGSISGEDIKVAFLNHSHE